MGCKGQLKFIGALTTTSSSGTWLVILCANRVGAAHSSHTISGSLEPSDVLSAVNLLLPFLTPPLSSAPHC